MDVAALVISVLAFLAAAASALFTRQYAKTAARDVSLQHEPQLILEWTRGVSVSAPDRRKVGGGLVLQVRNEGTTTAQEVTATRVGSKETWRLGSVRPGKPSSPIRPDVESKVGYVVTFKTVDGESRSKTLKPIK